MKKIKVREAEGPVLDWLVAKCSPSKFGPPVVIPHQNSKGATIYLSVGLYQAGVPFRPTKEQACGGRILDENGIGTLFRSRSVCRKTSDWFATPDDQEASESYEGEQFDPMFLVTESSGCYGPTRLVGGLRCFVISKLGEEVEVPEELLK